MNVFSLPVSILHLIFKTIHTRVCIYTLVSIEYRKETEFAICSDYIKKRIET